MTIAKIIELVGSSDEGWEDAARNALTGAHKTLHGISGIEVVGWTASVEDGEITRYRATVKVAFRVD
ncbi:MAG: dodecin family protein [Chloroflexota bacterium]|nr:dodecin family protein [Chloroflexota bacterium]